MKVKSAHPRIWLDDHKLAWLEEKTKGKSVADVRKMAGNSSAGLALVYAVNGDKDSGREAIALALKAAAGKGVDTEYIALTYDWCYGLLTPDEKAALCKKLADVARAGVAEKRAWRSFHNGGYTVGWRTTAATLAIYGDDPYAREAFAFFVPEWQDVVKTFDNVFADGAWGEGYNYNHHVINEAVKSLLALRTATGVDWLSTCVHCRTNGYYMVYGVKPDGLVFPGDDNDHPGYNWHEREALIIENDTFRDPYIQYFLNHCPVEDFAFPSSQKWKDLLWLDDSIPEKTPDTLPLSRIFRDDGLVFARSGWNWDEARKPADDTWVSFRCGKYYGDHAHYYNNSFEIYHKGELAIDSGRYDDDWGMEQSPETIRKSEFFNYYQRTIAHNTMLIYDGDEKFEMGVANDGGQLQLLRIGGIRNVPEDYDQGNFPTSDAPSGSCDWARNPGRWDTGEILAYKATRDFTYVCGDATKSYNAKKLKSYVRQFVFIQPSIVVVFDRVVSTKPEFRKTWLLHSVEEPKMAKDGSSFEVCYKAGRLVTVPLLPGKPVLTKIGGPGNECLVAGYHYKYGPNSEGNAAELDPNEIVGAWRIEECPSKPAAEDYFLNVMFVTDRDSTAMPAVKLENAPDAKAVTVKVSVPGGRTATLSFAKGDKPAASIKIEEAAKILFSGDMPSTVVIEDGRPI